MHIFSVALFWAQVFKRFFHGQTASVMEEVASVAVFGAVGAEEPGFLLVPSKIFYILLPRIAKGVQNMIYSMSICHIRTCFATQVIQRLLKTSSWLSSKILA